MIDKKTRERVLADYIHGAPVTGIAREYGIAYQTIYNFLEGEGIEMRRPKSAARRPKAGMSLQSKISEAYSKGMRVPEIADILDVSTPTVWRELMMAGIVNGSGRDTMKKRL